MKQETIHQTLASLIINEIAPRVARSGKSLTEVEAEILPSHVVALMADALHEERRSMREVREVIEDRVFNNFPTIPYSLQDVLDITYLNVGKNP